MSETFTIKGELYELASYGERFSDGSRRATVRLAPKADDPVSDLVVKSHEPPQTHTKSAQSDPKRKANT